MLATSFSSLWSYSRLKLNFWKSVFRYCFSHTKLVVYHYFKTTKKAPYNVVSRIKTQLYGPPYLGSLCLLKIRIETCNRITVHLTEKFLCMLIKERKLAITIESISHPKIIANKLYIDYIFLCKYRDSMQFDAIGRYPILSSRVRSTVFRYNKNKKLSIIYG